jgi:hypothetical protein
VSAARDPLVASSQATCTAAGRAAERQEHILIAIAICAPKQIMETFDVWNANIGDGSKLPVGPVARCVA